MFDETGWTIDEIRLNPDPQLVPYFQGADLTAVTNIELPRLVLRNLNQEDVQDLMTLQFFVRATPR